MTAFTPSGLQDSDIEKLQQMNERDEIIEVYQYLATHGDQYAKAALPVVEAALGGNEPTGFMDRFFQAIVKIHWNNVTPGAYESLFPAVAKTFQANYLKALYHNNGTNAWPITEQIEVAYRTAVEAEGLPALIAIDGIISRLDLAAGSGGVADFTWAWFLGINNLPFVAVQGERIKYDVKVFEDLTTVQCLRTFVADGLGLVKQGLGSSTWEAGKIAIYLAAPLASVTAETIYNKFLDFTDQIGLYGLFMSLDSGVLTVPGIERIVKASAISDETTLKATLDALGKIFNLPTANVENRTYYYNTLENWLKEIETSGPRGKFVDLTNKSSGELIELAKSDVAYRYALKELNPFAVLGADYSIHNQSGELNLAKDGGEITDQYLTDRALFLSGFIEANTKDTGTGKNLRADTGGEPIYFEDKATGITLQTQNSGSGQGTSGPNYRFGGTDNDTFFGTDQVDHLYGGAGMDQLDGGKGDDYIEGNAGSDTFTGGKGNDTLIGGKGLDIYIFESGDGWDLIEDQDGQGAIYYDDIQLTEGKAVGDSGMVWQQIVNKGTPAEKTFTYILTDWTENGQTSKRLSIQGKDGGMWIKGWSNGQLGITLPGASTPNQPPSTTPPPADALVGGSSTSWLSEYGSTSLADYYTDNGLPYTIYPTMQGGTGNAYINGNHATTINGGQGSSWIVGRSPENTTSTGSQTIQGGKGDTLISTGTAAGTFIGGEGNSLIDARNYRTFTNDYVWQAIGSAFKLNFGWQASSEYRTHSMVTSSTPYLPADIAMWLTYVDGPLTQGDRIYTAQPGFGSEVISGQDSAGKSFSFDPITWIFTLDGASFQVYQQVSPIRNPVKQTLIGGKGDNVLLGNDAGNLLIGGGGVNVINGGQGDDRIFAGSHNDNIHGFGGDDFIEGGAGDSWLYGDDGNDTINGGSGNELIYAGANGEDWATAEAETSNRVDGNVGNDQIWGAGGNDTLSGGSGNDILRAGNGNDTLDGGADNDTLEGGVGNDLLQGGAGDDGLWGGDGNDTLKGGAGCDYLVGGSGDDVYFFESGESPRDALGLTEFVDDTSGNNSAIFAYTDITNMSVTRSGGSLVITNGNDQVMINGGFGGAIKTYTFGNGKVLDWATLVNNYFKEKKDQSSSSINDQLVGGSLGDTLTGTGGGSQFYGGQGNDTLIGSGGNNTYYFNLGDGADQITDNSAKTDLQGNAAPNTIHFGTGIASNNLRLAIDGWTLVIQAMNADGSEGGSIRINNFDRNSPLVAPAIDRFEFDDGTVLSLGELLALGFDGSDGDDSVTGTSLVDRLDGHGGDDVLDAQDGNDTLIGGKGNDTLQGGAGSDTFAFNLGDGNDFITDFSAEDSLQLGAGISVASLSVTAISGSDGAPALLLQTADGSVTIDHGFTQPFGSVSFADGSTLSQSQLMAQANLLAATLGGENGNFIFSAAAGDSIVGGAGNDTLSAWGADAILKAGTGNNNLEAHGARSVLVGGVGNDTLIAYGDESTLLAGVGSNQLTARGANNTFVLLQGGITTINDESGTGLETLWLPTGMSLADFIPVRVGENLLIVSASGDTQATLNGYFSVQPTDRQWVVSSDTDQARFLTDWIEEQSAPMSYSERVDAIQSTFSARLIADLNSRGANGASVGTLQDLTDDARYFDSQSGLWIDVGNYTFDGVSIQTVIGAGDTLNLEDATRESVELAQRTHTVSHTVSSYENSYAAGKTYTVTLPPGVSGIASPYGSMVTSLGGDSYRVDEPGSYRQVYIGETTITETVTVSTAEINRAFLVQNVEVGQEGMTIEADGVFLGSVVASDGDNLINLGTTSARQDDWLSEVPYWLGYSNSTQPFGVGAFVRVGNGNNTVIGTDGNDVLAAGTGNNFLDGGRGSDTYYAPLSSDSLSVIDDSGNPGENVNWLFYGGEFPLDTLVLPDGIGIEDLKIRVYADPDNPLQNILQINHGDANILVVFTDPKPNWTGISVEAAIGVERFQFADGTLLTRDQLIAQATVMQNDFNPVVTTQDQTLSANQSAAISDWVTASDNGSNTITRYQLALGGDQIGALTLNGQVVNAGKTLDIGATQFAQLSYVAGETEGVDLLRVRVFDGAVWSDWSEAFLNTKPPGPVITPSSNTIVDAYRSVALTQFFVASNTANLPITQFEIRDETEGSGSLMLDGHAIEGSTLAVPIEVLSRVRYLSGTNGDTDTIRIRAFDGVRWSDWSDLNLFASSASDVLYGDTEHGQLQAGTGDQILVAGYGNTLVGGNGSDTFVLTLGCGPVTIIDSVTDVGDTIQFGANIAYGWPSPYMQGNDLVIDFGDQGDQVVIKDVQGGLAGGPSVISRFLFADGSYATFDADASGNTKWQHFSLQGELAEQYWTRVDGSNGWESYPQDGGSERWEERQYADGSFYWSETSTSADGSYEEYWGKGDGSEGSELFIASTGEITRTARNAGDDYAYTYHRTSPEEGVTEYNETYTYDNGSIISTDSAESSISWTLQADANALTLIGMDAINGTGNALDNVLCGNDAANLLDGGAGDDVIKGEDGNDVLIGDQGNDVLEGGTGADLMIGGAGNDSLTVDIGNNIILFNRGDGQDTLTATGLGSNTISIGGDIDYADLSFCKTNNDLVLNLGSSDQITFKDWYAASSSRTVSNLQVITEAMADFAPGGGNPLLDQKVENFNFSELVGAFDTACLSDSGITSWALTNALTNFQLAGSDTAAIGGDLAYQYGKNGSLAGIGILAAQSVVGNSGFGSQAQALQGLSGLQQEADRLA